MARDTKPNVGIRLRTFRERQGWSLRALSDRCGLSINAISRIERGENSPTVSSLTRLSSALNIQITDFFNDRDSRSAVFVKKGLGFRTSNSGFEVEHLSTGLNNQLLEPFLLSIEPAYSGASNPVTHPGEEFVHCLSGEVEFCIGDQPYSLKAGDSLLFQAMQPHHLTNPTSSAAILLLVFQAAQDNSLARQRHHTG